MVNKLVITVGINLIGQWTNGPAHRPVHRNFRYRGLRPFSYESTAFWVCSLTRLAGEPFFECYCPGKMGKAAIAS
jgi:hypothetical protein